MISQHGSNVGGSFGSEACEQAIAKAGQHLRGVPLADLAGVFTERHVADVVRTVLDAPVPSVPTQQGRGIRQATRHARDPIRHLVLLFAAAPTLDATDLSHARPNASRLPDAGVRGGRVLCWKFLLPTDGSDAASRCRGEKAG